MKKMFMIMFIMSCEIYASQTREKLTREEEEVLNRLLEDHNTLDDFYLYLWNDTPPEYKKLSKEFIYRNKDRINIQDKDGNISLHHAVEAGKKDNIKTLLELNVNKNIKNNNWQTPLQIAQKRFEHAFLEDQKEWQEIIDLLDEKKESGKPEIVKQTQVISEQKEEVSKEKLIMSEAVKKEAQVLSQEIGDNIDTFVKKIQEIRFKINKDLERYENVLIEVIKLKKNIINKDASGYDYSYGYIRPLTMALLTGRINVIKALLENGAETKFKNRASIHYNKTPLELAQTERNKSNNFSDTLNWENIINILKHYEQQPLFISMENTIKNLESFNTDFLALAR